VRHVPARRQKPDPVAARAAGIHRLRARLGRPRGTGFYQKVETDHVLRDLVCRRTLSLAVAQHDEETNWYAAWLRYVVATGSA
jgi:hypothetical protein